MPSNALAAFGKWFLSKTREEREEEEEEEIEGSEGSMIVPPEILGPLVIEWLRSPRPSPVLISSVSRIFAHIVEVESRRFGDPAAGLKEIFRKEEMLALFLRPLWKFPSAMETEEDLHFHLTSAREWMGLAIERDPPTYSHVFLIKTPTIRGEIRTRGGLGVFSAREASPGEFVATSLETDEAYALEFEPGQRGAVTLVGSEGRVRGEFALYLGPASPKQFGWIYGALGIGVRGKAWWNDVFEFADVKKRFESAKIDPLRVPENAIVTASMKTAMVFLRVDFAGGMQKKPSFSERRNDPDAMSMYRRETRAIDEAAKLLEILTGPPWNYDPVVLAGRDANILLPLPMFLAAYRYDGKYLMLPVETGWEPAARKAMPRATRDKDYYIARWRFILLHGPRVVIPFPPTEAYHRKLAPRDVVVFAERATYNSLKTSGLVFQSSFQD